MTILKRIKIKYKLAIIVLFGMLGMGVVIYVSLNTLKDNMLKEKEIKTRHVVETTYGLLDHYYKLSLKGKITEQEAKAAALAEVRDLRYEEKEYFWINDSKLPFPEMIMHPTVPSLDGKVLDDVKFNVAKSMQAGLDGKVVETDGKKNLFQAFVEVANEKGLGYVTYDWPKPLAGGGATKELFPKMSFVKKFQPWDWIIGSGIYIDDVNTAFWRQVKKFTLVAVGIMFLLAMISWPIVRSITRPVEVLAGISEKLETLSDGDLRVNIDYAAQDEVGVLVGNVNKMARSFSEMVGRIHVEANKIVTAIDALRALGEKTTSDAEKQSSQSHGVAAAAEEMSQTIADISKNISAASETSSEAMNTAAEGKKVADGAVETVGRVLSSTDELAKMIAKLNNRAGEIGEIVTVIQDIADQTNLLALNAAIEAARAGEQGRGFAVVADEVRKLAERTIKATSEISEKIKAVQTEANQTTRSMSLASGEVTKATDYMRNVGDSLESIVGSVQKARDQITRIATAVEEQSTTSEDVAKNAETTAVIAKDMEKLSGNVMQEVDKLTSIAAELRGASAKFKVHGYEAMITDLVKTDLRIWMNKIASCLKGDMKIDPSEIADTHACMLGKWYYGEGKQMYGHLPGFRTIETPHDKLHSLGKQSIEAYYAGSYDKAKRIYGEMEAVSKEVADLFDKMKRELGG